MILMQMVVLPLTLVWESFNLVDMRCVDDSERHDGYFQESGEDRVTVFDDDDDDDDDDSDDDDNDDEDETYWEVSELEKEKKKERSERRKAAYRRGNRNKGWQQLRRGVFFLWHFWYVPKVRIPYHHTIAYHGIP